MRAAEASITRDAQARDRRGELKGPITRTECGPLLKAKDAVPDDRILSKAIGRYDCVAVKTSVTGEGGQSVGRLGFPFVAALDFKKFTYVWCRNTPGQGERGVALAFVRLDRACLAAKGRALGTGYVDVSRQLGPLRRRAAPAARRRADDSRSRVTCRLARSAGRSRRGTASCRLREGVSRAASPSRALWPPARPGSAGRGLLSSSMRQVNAAPRRRATAAAAPRRLAVLAPLRAGGAGLRAGALLGCLAVLVRDPRGHLLARVVRELARALARVAHDGEADPAQQDHARGEDQHLLPGLQAAASGAGRLRRRCGGIGLGLGRAQGRRVLRRDRRGEASGRARAPRGRAGA